MSEKKISVAEYLKDRDLLEIIYVPYEERKEICKVIINECKNVSDGFSSLDSVLLDRVKKEVFLSAITNLDFTIIDENGLDGYDQLCFSDELDGIIENCGYLYYQFEEILELMLKDYYNNEGSLRWYLNNLKTLIMNKISVFRDDVTDYIDNLDANQIAENISKIVKLNK